MFSLGVYFLQFLAIKATTLLDKLYKPVWSINLTFFKQINLNLAMFGKNKGNFREKEIMF